MTGEHFDVLIIGAGISGVGAGCRLQQQCPDRSFAILEAREAIGGTWDLFRFPGIRSDSDMFTLCYPFRPWRASQAIVDGAAILEYVRDTAREYGVDRCIRFNHRVVGAQWSSADSRWTVEVERGDSGETAALTCGFLYSCTGYYRYDQGYSPEFPGSERFGGEIVHPQFWSDDIDHAGKRVVVIGSGATAVTLVPALAQTAAHVTMLQRSPSYVVSLPGEDVMAAVIQRMLPARLAYPLIRRKNVMIALGIYRLSQRRPEIAKRLLRRLLERELPAGFDIDTHFKPSYEPWDQRLCVVPNGDLFAAISDGRVSVVTDRIESFTETGLALESGAQLEADLVVTATGLQLVPLGGMELGVDGFAVDIGETVMYRGMMLGGIPNLAYAFGYPNQSWTLGADLTSEQVCRLLNHMRRHGYTQCAPREVDATVGVAPFIDLSSGYVQRAIDLFPKQAAHDPWRREQHYPRDRRAVTRSLLEDPVLEFASAASAVPARARVAA